MKFSKLLTVIACTFAIAGCAATYQEPTQKDAATIEFRKAGAFTAQAAIYGGAAGCTERHLLPVMSGDQALVRKVVPSAPLSFSMTYSKNLLLVERFCVDTLTFTPESAHRYVASLQVTDGKCHIDLKDAGTAAAPLSTPISVTSHEHTWTRAMTEQGPFCGS